MNFRTDVWFDGGVEMFKNNIQYFPFRKGGTPSADNHIEKIRAGVEKNWIRNINKSTKSEDPEENPLFKTMLTNLNSLPTEQDIITMFRLDFNKLRGHSIAKNMWTIWASTIIKAKKLVPQNTSRLNKRDKGSSHSTISKINKKAKVSSMAKNESEGSSEIEIVSNTVPTVHATMEKIFYR